MARCIVTDLDRTLTGADLKLDDDALARIGELRRAGIQVIVATGRRFDDAQVVRLLGHVDGMVAENGAVVTIPSEGLVEIRHAGFAEQARAALGQETASRFVWGRVVGSAPREVALAAARALNDAQLAHAFEYNAEEVMLLPEAVSKATGCESCVVRLGLTARDAWAIGDGENDVSMLAWAEVGAAPANAAPEAAAAADVLLVSSYAQAFLELTDALLSPRAAKEA